MEPNKHLSSEFDLKDKEVKQAFDFQKVVLEEFKKLDPTLNRIDYYTDIDNVTRFLIARDFKVPKALEMWKKWYNWRITYRADSIKEEEIEGNLKSGKAYWQGHDKNKHPCLVIKTRRHFPGQGTVEDNIRFGVHTIEQGVEKMQQNGVSKMCVIWDREGFDPKKNFDKSMLTVMKQLVGILQDFYAERLDTVYILRPNWFFKMIVGMIKPFLSDKTKKKLKLISNPKELLNYFDSDQLGREYGGTSTFEYAWPPGSAPIRDGFDPATASTANDDVEDESVRQIAESEMATQ